MDYMRVTRNVNELVAVGLTLVWGQADPKLTGFSQKDVRQMEKPAHDERAFS